jgi:hypothetical protein
MWHRRFALRFLAYTLGLLLSQALTGASATLQAQDDTPSWNKTPSKTKPAAAPPASSPARTRQRVPPGSARRAPRAPLTPLLSMQYRILKVEQNGSQIEVSPITVFNPGDRIRFSIKTDVDCYLYIIRQRDPDEPGKVVFPNTQINAGQNFLRRGQEFFVPSGCPQGTTSWDCTYTVGTDSGQDFYTFVFSRDTATNLPLNALTDDAHIKPQALRQLWVTSRQKLSEPQRGDTDFSLRVRNLNRNADDELILRYVLNKRTRTGESK